MASEDGETLFGKSYQKFTNTNNTEETYPQTRKRLILSTFGELVIIRPKDPKSLPNDFSLSAPQSHLILP